MNADVLSRIINALSVSHSQQSQKVIGTLEPALLNRPVPTKNTHKFQSGFKQGINEELNNINNVREFQKFQRKKPNVEHSLECSMSKLLEPPLEPDRDTLLPACNPHGPQWWGGPVAGWSEGWISISNILRDETVLIDLTA